MWSDRALGNRVSFPPFNFEWLEGVYLTIVWQWLGENMKFNPSQTFKKKTIGQQKMSTCKIFINLLNLRKNHYEKLHLSKPHYLKTKIQKTTHI